jgi:hypothetical protein
MRCHSCGSEYIPSVEVCPDCELPLVPTDPEAADPEAQDPEGGAGRGGQVEYELHEWAVESRAMLEQLLEGAGIPRAWEGTDLVVPAACEAQVDELIEQVQVTTLPSLDADAPKLVYELTDWSDDDVTRLASALDELVIPYEFDVEGNLVVLEVDEQRVEELLDSIEYPDALKPEVDADDGYDGVDVIELLGELFVAVDRLQHHAGDHEGVLAFVSGAPAVLALDTPFGFAPGAWNDIKGRVERLREGLEADTMSDDEIEQHAAELRRVLRNYV